MPKPTEPVASRPGSRSPGVLLALDASGEPASACVLLASDRSSLEVAASGVRAGDVLHLLASNALAACGVTAREVGRVAACRGPGSFTGLRVGLAAAQGLALACGAEAVGVETTRVIAQASGRRGILLVAIDGGQGRWFTGVHERGDGIATPLEGPLDLSPDELVARMRKHRGASLLRAGAIPPAFEGAELVSGPLARALAEIAREIEPEPASLEALYARAPAIRPPKP